MLFVFSCVFLTLNILAERDVGTHTHAVGVRAVQVHSREPCAAATHSEHSRPGSTIKDAPDAGVCRAAVPSGVTSTASQVTTGFHRQPVSHVITWEYSKCNQWDGFSIFFFSPPYFIAYFHFFLSFRRSVAHRSLI